ncbi:MAG: MFS transporter [Synergistaceae bacterium]|nr:MFS transporter [Synergistaceae bacterium]
MNLIVPSMVRKWGKQKILILGSLCMIAGSVVIGLAGASFGLAMFGVCIRGAGIGFIFSSLFAMTADVVDYGEWKFGIRSEGLVNSCTSFGMKLGIGFGLAIGSWIIALGGYDGTAAVQTESAVASIKFAFGYSGAIFSVVVLILCVMMNLDKYIVQIQSDLEAKAASERKA